MNAQRQPEFQRNEKLEMLLEELNSLLAPVEAQAVAGFGRPRWPVVLVMGLPRSGTTLVLQWLAATGRFGYPTNLLSRFYAAPFIGAKIQLLLTDPAYRFRDEILSGSDSPSPYESDLGKTRGALAPNEFWYFWRRFLPEVDLRRLEEPELAQVKTAPLLAELAALESVLAKPLAMKGLILALNMPFLAGLMKQVLFLYIKREPLYNIQSLLEARERYWGNREQWYSIKPDEYQWLKQMPPIEQVAGQVALVSHSMEQDLASLDPARWLQVNYEEFCSNPRQVFEAVNEKLSLQQYRVPWTYQGPESFQVRNEIRLSRAEHQQVLRAYARFSKPSKAR